MGDFNENSSIEFHEYKFPCNDPTKCRPIEILLDQGVYVFELYGASGGNGYRTHLNLVTKGGNGGYTRGIVGLSRKTRVFLFIGGSGVTSDDGFAPGGWNGGGRGSVGLFNYYVGSGGGATDVRIGCNKLRCRRIVAGGGGGAGASSSAQTGDLSFGGSGGGLVGKNGTGYDYVDDEHSGKAVLFNSMSSLKKS